MRSLGVRRTRNSLRLIVYLFIAGCSQSAFETYGCACASRTYTTEEIADYRAGAARGDINALAEMQEYHIWRMDAQPVNSDKYRREEKLQRAYFERRIRLHDPKALDDEVHRLVYDAWFEQSLTNKQRREQLLEARGHALRLARPMTMPDFRDENRDDIPVLRYIDRELKRLDGTVVH